MRFLLSSSSDEFLAQLAIALFCIGVYVYYGLCLLRIAQRTGTKSAWWAWVPFLNGLLFFRIAGRPLWWAVLVVVPGVNVYILLRILVDVCRRCGESGWLTIVLLIPGVNLIAYTALTGAQGIKFAKMLGLMLLLLVIVPGGPVVADLFLHSSTKLQLRALRQNDPRIRKAALHNLIMQLQGDSSLANAGLTQAILPILTDPDPVVRRQAIMVLDRANMVTTEAVVELIKALDDPEYSFRENAAHALSYAPNEAKETLRGALPQLIREVERKNESAGYALGRIGSDAGPAVESLLQALRDPDLNMRQSAIFALGRIGTQSERVVPALVTALEDNTTAIQAAYALGLYGPAARSAVPALHQALNSSDDLVRRNARDALKKIESR